MIPRVLRKQSALMNRSRVYRARPVKGESLPFSHLSLPFREMLVVRAAERWRKVQQDDH